MLFRSWASIPRRVVKLSRPVIVLPGPIVVLSEAIVVSGGIVSAVVSTHIVAAMVY